MSTIAWWTLSPFRRLAKEEKNNAAFTCLLLFICGKDRQAEQRSFREKGFILVPIPGIDIGDGAIGS
jgi:hypothetical protein